MTTKLHHKDFDAEVKTKYGVTTISVRERLAGRAKSKKNASTPGANYGETFTFALKDKSIEFVEPEFPHQYRPNEDVIAAAKDFLEHQIGMILGAAKSERQTHQHGRH